MIFQKPADYREMRKVWTKLQPGWLSEVVRATEDYNCLIALQDRPEHAPWTPRANVVVRILRPLPGIQHFICRRDGVVSFIVDELVKLAEPCKWPEEESLFCSAIQQLANELNHNDYISLADFHAYKEKFR